MTLDDFNLKMTDFLDGKVIYSVDQLKEIVFQLSVDIPNAKPGAVTLAYSGALDPSYQGVWSTGVAEAIGANSDGYVREKLGSESNFTRPVEADGEASMSGWRKIMPRLTGWGGNRTLTPVFLSTFSEEAAMRRKWTLTPVFPERVAENAAFIGTALSQFVRRAVMLISAFSLAITFLACSAIIFDAVSATSDNLFIFCNKKFSSANFVKNKWIEGKKSKKYAIKLEDILSIGGDDVIHRWMLHKNSNGSLTIVVQLRERVNSPSDDTDLFVIMMRRGDAVEVKRYISAHSIAISDSSMSGVNGIRTCTRGDLSGEWHWNGSDWVVVEGVK